MFAWTADTLAFDTKICDWPPATEVTMAVPPLTAWKVVAPAVEPAR